MKVLFTCDIYIHFFIALAVIELLACDLGRVVFDIAVFYRVFQSCVGVRFFLYFGVELVDFLVLLIYIYADGYDARHESDAYQQYCQHKNHTRLFSFHTSCASVRLS